VDEDWSFFKSASPLSWDFKRRINPIFEACITVCRSVNASDCPSSNLGTLTDLALFSRWSDQQRFARLLQKFSHAFCQAVKWNLGFHSLCLWLLGVLGCALSTGVKTNCLYSREIVSTLMGPGAVSRFTLIWPWSQLVWGAGNHKNRDFLRSFLCRNEAGERHGLRFSRQRVAVNVGNIQYARVKSKIFRHFFVYVYTVYGVNNFRQ